MIKLVLVVLGFNPEFRSYDVCFFFSLKREKRERRMSDCVFIAAIT